MDTLWTVERFEDAGKKKRQSGHWGKNVTDDYVETHKPRAKIAVTASFIIDTQTQLGLLSMRSVVWSDSHVTGCYLYRSYPFRQRHISRPIQRRSVQFHYQNWTTYENQRRNRLTSLRNISTARLFYKHYSFPTFSPFLFVAWDCHRRLKVFLSFHANNRIHTKMI